MYPVCIHVNYFLIIHVCSIYFNLIIGRIFLCYMIETKKVFYPSFSNSFVSEILKMPFNSCFLVQNQKGLKRIITW